ncbi:MAG: peptidyl-prolyl cis-trans isomerase [Deltaproteobacteria bacterium]|nr:MAG: peptidyl-prolyl cis-trans isomerase [Deltaproteobacteria bacterium]
MPKRSVVELDTTMGKIQIELFRNLAPVTTSNFIEYVKSGFYNGTIFHRVIPNFMVQGGGLTPDMTKKKTRAAIQNEADNGLKNERGTLAMARTSAPHSATAQFFINVKNNPFLNHRGKTLRGWGYCVFGKVIKGMDVVDKIRYTKTATKGFRRNVPVQPVIIRSAKLLP